MEKVSICAAINEKKKAEFFQTTESLQPLINHYCKDLKITIDSKNNVSINIIFEDKKQLENYYQRTEFNILKGSVKSLCYDINIEINDLVVN